MPIPEPIAALWGVCVCVGYSDLLGLCHVVVVITGRGQLHHDHMEWVSHENEYLFPAEIDCIEI